MAKKVKEVLDLLIQNGWILVEGGKGSHRKLKKDGERFFIIVPGKLSDTLPIGTEKSILKQAGIK
ncbi:MAG: type II toxin-antitoxin system HicA family toxin [Tannerellaceae bacterium]